MSVRSAYILAAGLGTRLRPLTDQRPKPLVEVGTVPLIHVALDNARLAGVKRIVVNTHHLHPLIEEQIGPDYEGTPVTYSHEPEILGTGGGLRQMWESIGKPNETAVVLNADALIDIDIKAMAALHKERKGLATLAVKDAKDKADFGTLGSDENDQILGFAGRTQNKGPFKKERMFCGVHIVESALLEALPEGFSGVNEVGYPPLIDEGAVVTAFDIGDGYFCDVGTAERLLEANRAMLGEVKLKHVRGTGKRVHRNAYVDHRAELSKTVSVGDGASVGPGAKLDDCCIQAGAIVPEGAKLKGAIIYRGGVIETGAVALPA